MQLFFIKFFLALVFDNTGSPRFLEEILGVTKQLGFVEFIVRFKYSRQERLIDGKNLKSRVPQMVRKNSKNINNHFQNFFGISEI